MPTFLYRATEKNGQSVEGRLDASDASAVAVELRSRGLLPTRIEKTDATTVSATGAPSAPTRTAPPGERVGTPSKIEIAPFLNAVPLTDLSAMYRQLATLLHAGVPMLQSTTTLAQQTRQPRLRAVLADAAQRVSTGLPFSSALEAHPGVFTTMQIELIRAGEMGGMLETMCLRIASYLERENEIRRKLKKETLYPKIVLSLAFVVTGIVGFAGAGFGQAGLDVVKAKLLFAAMFGGASLGIWWLVRFLNQLPAFGAAWDLVKMAIPGAGGVSRRYATARFTRAMGTLYSAGVFLPRAVEIAGRACGNRAIGQRMVENTHILLNGGGLTAMLEESGLLDPMAVQMARTGEHTGSLDEMMDKVADYLESDADVKAHQLAVGAGVAALLVAAVVVGIVVISFYSGYMGGLMQTGNG